MPDPFRWQRCQWDRCTLRRISELMLLSVRQENQIARSKGNAFSVDALLLLVLTAQFVAVASQNAGRLDELHPHKILQANPSQDLPERRRKHRQGCFGIDRFRFPYSIHLSMPEHRTASGSQHVAIPIHLWPIR